MVRKCKSVALDVPVMSRGEDGNLTKLKKRQELEEELVPGHVRVMLR